MKKHLRKIIIGLIAAAAVVIAFKVYTHCVDAQPINISQSNQQEPILQEPVFNSDQKIAGNQIGGVDDAEFITLDEVTKQPKRVFGFEKLLNPEKNSEKWRLRKPYMKFFGDSFQCQIVSKEGDVEVETVLGNPSPRNAKLYNDVKINITFENKGVPVTGVISLEDLDYDSERSELATEKSVEAVFDDVYMQGTGMVLIYNTAKGRIEYFEIIDLDIIRIKDVAMLSDKESKDEKAQPSKTAKDSQPGKTYGDKSKAVTVRKGETSSPAQVTAEVDKEEKCLYNCKFRDEVTIEYGDEIVAVGHEELNINNILFASSSPSKPKPQTQSVKAPSNSDKSQNQAAVTAKRPEAKAASPQEAVDGAATEVIVTCKGGFVIRPMANIAASGKLKEQLIADDSFGAFISEIEKANLAESSVVSDVRCQTTDVISIKAMPENYDAGADIEYVNFAASVDKNNKKPTRFHAAKIDYDMTSGDAYATGPVKLLIYMKDKEDDLSVAKNQVPVTITAKNNAEYFSETDRMIFNGNVVGTRKTVSDEFVTDNTFYGDQLVVDLISGGSSQESIRHIAVLGEDVMMDSVKKSGDVTVNYIRLESDRIDYDGQQEVVTAKGAGRIEINNENAPEPEERSGAAGNLQGPCFAWIENFETLEWSTVTNKIVVDTINEDSMVISHVPITNGQWGLPSYATARHVEADFMITLDGRTELALMRATEGVSYTEKWEDGNIFIGDKLSYKANDSMLVVLGTSGEPCTANGIKTKRIKYDLQRRQLLTGISGPGAFSMPRNRRK